MSFHNLSKIKSFDRNGRHHETRPRKIMQNAMYAFGMGNGQGAEGCGVQSKIKVEN